MDRVKPTILVPGFSDDAGSLHTLERFLQRQGIPAYTISPQPSNGQVRIEVLAERLAAAIAERFPAPTPIDLVGFSMGGLICRSYLQQMESGQRIERLLTIATPHQGTWTAYTYDRPACIQMRPGSHFLKALNRDLAPLQRITFTSIWTPLDLTILPASSSYLPVGEMVPMLSPFHRTLVIDPRILHTVAIYLRKPGNGNVEYNRGKDSETATQYR
jgi:triacylglycerol lipase